MLSYDPFRWFWIDRNGIVFDSEKLLKTDEHDQRYKDWVAAGGIATPWPADAEGQQTDLALQEVLAVYGLRVAPSTLADLKEELKSQIDVAAEEERLKYITPGAGQAMTYQQKIEEVRALAQDTEPNPANYLLLSAEIGITGPTLAEVASAVLAAYQQWQVIGAAIERVRLGAKAAVDAAETAAAAMAAATSVIWPDP